LPLIYDAPNAAGRYDAARLLSPETMGLWMAALRSTLPQIPINRILDLGCGTGRFTGGLSEEFGCRVVGVEPSESMLGVAMSQRLPNVEWKHGSADVIPLADSEVGLVFMSQVLHHIPQPDKAFQEIRRVLAPQGCLAIRNATLETNASMPWLRCFPEAMDLDNRRLLSRNEVEQTICLHGFDVIATQTVPQVFASSYGEYCEKIGGRGLSALISISDEAFENGMVRLRAWAAGQPEDEPVREEIDLFVFQRRDQL
jgi:ubiquinone/menaquinone biosynthesis C-methylase UbiE